MNLPPHSFCFVGSFDIVFEKKMRESLGKNNHNSVRTGSIRHKDQYTARDCVYLSPSMSLALGRILLHSSATATMIYGYNGLNNLPVISKFINEQYGGHFQYLTIQCLFIAIATTSSGLALDLFPSATCEPVPCFIVQTTKHFFST